MADMPAIIETGSWQATVMQFYLWRQEKPPSLSGRGLACCLLHAGSRQVSCWQFFYAWASPAFCQTCVLAAFACVAVGVVAVAHLLKSGMELAKTTLCVAELQPLTVTVW